MNSKVAMLRRFLAPLALPLLLGACATAPTANTSLAAAPPAPAATDTGIVSAADPRAAEAGVEILRKGGSATDAAIATMLALNVVEPQNSGIGGGLYYLRHDGASGTLTTLDGRETAPATAGPEWFYGPDGKPLSKRMLGDYTLEAIRAMGVEPMAVNCMLALLGTAEAAEPLLSLDELAKGFDIAKLGRGQIRFEAQEIERLNAGLLHKTPYEAVKTRLAERGMDSPEFWEAVRPNLTLFDGAAEWWHVIEGPVEPVIEPEDADFVAEALAALPGEPWDGSTWKSWTDTLKSSTGRKGKALFMPLRLALTGLRHGPELANLLPLIGPERAKARLSGKT